MTSHICLVWRGLSIKQQSGRKEQMDRKLDILSADPGTQTKKLPPLKSHVQSYFIQTSTAITVSSNRQSEYVISSIFLKADSLTIIEDPLLFWQPKSCHWGSVWVFQASLDTHFCHYFPLPSLSFHVFFFFCSSLSESTPLSPHNNLTS